jgi:hypothetical protein
MKRIDILRAAALVENLKSPSGRKTIPPIRAQNKHTKLNLFAQREVVFAREI